MDVNQRFDDLTDICHTCGALAVERERHNKWHNELEHIANGLLALGGAFVTGWNPETPTENTLSATTAPPVVPNASEPSPATPRSET